MVLNIPPDLITGLQPSLIDFRRQSDMDFTAADIRQQSGCSISDRAVRVILIESYNNYAGISIINNIVAFTGQKACYFNIFNRAV